MPQPSDERKLNLNDILKVLDGLDKQLSGMTRKVDLYGIGGTFMMLKKFRKNPVSKDLDFIISRRDSMAISGAVADIQFKQGVRIDLMEDGQFSRYKYSDYACSATRSNHSYENINLFLIGKADFILTKALAGRDHDLEDIQETKVTPAELSREELEKRYGRIVPLPEKAKELQENFTRFVNQFYAIT